MSVTSPEVTIVIVSYNKAGILRETLRSLSAIVVTPPTEVVVVDNASTDENVQMLQHEFPSILLIRNDSNLGFGTACNQGARVSRSPYLLFVNSDILLRKNPVPRLLTLMKRDPLIGIVGSQLMNADGTKQPSYYRFPGLLLRILQLTGMKDVILKLLPNIRYCPDDVFETDLVSGAFLLIAREHFFEIGGFDERYFMYLEDADLCYQSRLLGRTTVVSNSDDVTHLGKHQESTTDPFVFRHINRGQIIFYKKNYRRWKLYVLTFLSITLYSVRYCLRYIVNPRDSNLDPLRLAILSYCKVLGSPKQDPFEVP